MRYLVGVLGGLIALSLATGIAYLGVKYPKEATFATIPVLVVIIFGMGYDVAIYYLRRKKK